VRGSVRVRASVGVQLDFRGVQGDAMRRYSGLAAPCSDEGEGCVVLCPLRAAAERHFDGNDVGKSDTEKEREWVVTREMKGSIPGFYPAEVLSCSSAVVVVRLIGVVLGRGSSGTENRCSAAILGPYPCQLSMLAPEP
jgi:hypothetical protein